MKQTTLRLFIAILAVAANAFVYADSNDLEYWFNSETMTASLIGGPYVGDVVVPETAVNPEDGLTYTVTELWGGFCGYHHLDNDEKLTSLKLPNTLTTIRAGSIMDCNGLKSLVIPASVIDIRLKGLQGCYDLTSVIVEEGNPVYDSRDNCNAIIETATNKLIAGCENTVIPGSVRTIGEHAFGCSKMESLVIPEGVDSIGQYAFGSCYKLKEVTFSNSVRAIGEMAFHANYNLTTITFGTGLKNLYWDSFCLLGSLKDVYCYAAEPPSAPVAFPVMYIENAVLHVPDGTRALYKAVDIWKSFGTIMEMSEDNIIVFADKNVKSLCLANWDTNQDGEMSQEEAAAVTDIGTVFGYNKNITSFNELAYFTGLTAINDYAFSYCEKLKSITIPCNVSSIGTNILGRCNSLETIVVDEGNSNFDSRNDCNAIIETQTNTLLSGCKNTVIPDGITAIGDYAFNGMSDLTSLTIPESVTCIGEGAFNRCTGLESINIPSGLTMIEASVFQGCAKLVSIDIPSSVVNIGNNAFSDCDALLSVTISEGVQSIGDWAFYGCDNLTSISISQNLASLGEEVFLNNPKLESIVVDSRNTTFDSRNDCNAIIETQSNTLLYGCKNTVFPKGITTIGAFAFEECTGLESIELPLKLNKIELGAFYGCTNLSTVTISASVTKIAQYAFYGCKELTTVTSYIKEPFDIDDVTFTHNGKTLDTDKVTLYVPKGTKEKYQAAAGWKNFTNIVEIDLEPMGDGETVNIGDNIDGDTDLDGNIVGNILYNVSSGNGEFDAEEGCIVVSTPTSDETMGELSGKDVFGEDFKDQYTGIVFKVAPGSGKVKVEAQTTGRMVLKIKIGDQEPLEMELEGKLKISWPYNVTEETFVYIYGSTTASLAKGQRSTRSANDDALKIYSIEVEQEYVLGDMNGDKQISIADVTALVNIILGKDNEEPYEYNHKAADVNGDKVISVADVTALVNKILGR